MILDMVTGLSVEFREEVSTGGGKFLLGRRGRMRDILWTGLLITLGFMMGWFACCWLFK